MKENTRIICYSICEWKEKNGNQNDFVVSIKNKNSSIAVDIHLEIGACSVLAVLNIEWVSFCLLWIQHLPATPTLAHLEPMHRWSIDAEMQKLLMNFLPFQRNKTQNEAERGKKTTKNGNYHIHWWHVTWECEPCAQGLAASCILSSPLVAISPQFLWE